MNHQEKIRDITPCERELLARLRFRPEVFLGDVSLRNFFHMSSGYQYAMQTAGLPDVHNLLPDGLNHFTERWYGGEMGTRNWYSMIALHEPDDAEALVCFFEILDAYLMELGFAPLPVIESREQFAKNW